MGSKQQQHQQQMQSMLQRNSFESMVDAEGCVMMADQHLSLDAAMDSSLELRKGSIGGVSELIADVGSPSSGGGSGTSGGGTLNFVDALFVGGN